jgi:DUF1680 family protein
LNESYAELYARTRDRAMAQNGRADLRPQASSILWQPQQDKLANFHANTQVPKLIGLARLYEHDGTKPQDADAATVLLAHGHRPSQLS